MNSYRVRRNRNTYGDPLGLTAALRRVRGLLRAQPGPYSLKVGDAWGPKRSRLRIMARLTYLLPLSDPEEIFRVRCQADQAEGVTVSIKTVDAQPAGTVPSPYGPYYPTVGPCTIPPNMVTFTSEAGNRVVLQTPAAASFKAVERDYGPFRITGSSRTCEFQEAAYKKDPNRYAPPDTTRHTRGLAIDVHTGDITNRLNTSLAAHGWRRSRPTDEPWHWSYAELG